MIKKENLMQKHGIMLMTLAQEFLNKNEGDRIDTVATMSEKYNMARGTIQTALRILQENNAIVLEPRGHLGTFIRYIDYKKLLSLSGIDNIVCVMPLPYTKRYEGIATGVYNVINKNVQFSLAFMRGSENRLKFLEEGRYDLAIISRLTANYYIDNDEKIEIVASLGKQSYVKGHALIVRNDYTDYFKGMKIGIDKSSYDQYSLTMNYFKDYDVEFVEIQYSHVVELIQNKELDAAIWSEDETIYRGKNLKIIPLENKDKDMLDTEAVIIADKANNTIINFITKLINVEEILKIQRKVINNELVPNY
ncbi:GntR family transcriptional regulator YhfZ [Clostridium butyricum]|uniref:GntR family transcriptional regulator YhfZ n=1 Tax=Clostridium butyricum TaxID=1492 RepID=UPI003D32F5DD